MCTFVLLMLVWLALSALAGLAWARWYPVVGNGPSPES